MAGTDDLAIVELGVDDAPAGLALSTEAHWNQNEADWQFFLSHGIVFGVRDGDHLIATAALLPYSDGNAWISMVLVTASWQRRGLATRLVDACLDAARQRKLTTWLDATPAGTGVYGPLGFTPTLELRRLRLTNATGGREGTKASLAGQADDLIRRDRSAYGFERKTLLQEFCGRSGSRLASNDKAIALVRDGRVARHVGPLFADDAAGAIALVEAIAQSETRPLIIDAVHSQTDFLKGLVAAGWTIERPFQRMRFGPRTTPGAEQPFAVAGPEFG
ncbi:MULTISPECIES: GNAT family N-acetyltransferase [unclassified Bradyrhizobium]|uniref:GNAT family N-acetyltransferase n=1 Tax=unclassified Bradyrhizobium TaxID=2631580 RepID=UPI0024795DCB|nr:MULTISPECIES: GNAT family N-acetyltransferase [unclassified Bradyrhizobium]WGS22698.1 GNAT family N-acetyltransferase [Bradyrhizobium sp. ISRA463]WGS29686.1 GNAT family N-acetyltransferase [Bradyrhizobium sp. ISRA464]